MPRFAPLLCALAVAAAVASPALAETRALRAAEVLFWSQAQKENGFQHMEDQFAYRTAHHGDHHTMLATGKALNLALPPVAAGADPMKGFMDAQKAAGVIVVHKGKVRLESYNLGFSATGRWTSFSVAKSFTSTLVGAAVKDGYIKSIDDPVTTYIKGLKGSAYEGVTVRQILTMTSGVQWNEDYTDANSDVAKFVMTKPEADADATVAYMRKLKREAAPGSKWVYKTGETNLIGALVMQATHKTLSQYLEEKIWKPAGMETDAAWMTDLSDEEIGGCCLSVTVRDYARMGVFLIGGAKANGVSILPDGWLEKATRKQADIGDPGHGYGFQWWTNDDGTYDALGIFGQRIHIDPKRELVVVFVSAWPTAEDDKRRDGQTAFCQTVAAAVDAQP